MESSEVKSKKSRNVILSYNNKLYFVNGVNVQIEEGVGKINAVFHAKRAIDDESQDLDIEINQGLYDILLEYAKLDKLDLILVLRIEGLSNKWCLMSEDWMKNQPTNLEAPGYVV